MRTHINADTAVLDWLDTFASTVEYDEITRLWTVHPRNADYPARTGRSLRAAAGATMRAAMAVDAAPRGLRRTTSGL